MSADKDKGPTRTVAVTPFLTWDFVHAGCRGWREEAARSRWKEPNSSFLADVPSGIELEVQAASKSEAVLRPDKPWEENLSWVQAMFDDGRYRMWYGVLGPVNGYCYAESSDGMHWEKPDLGLVEVGGSTSNNLVLGGKANHSMVFNDPTAPAEARYRLMQFRAGWEGEPGEELDNEEGLRRLNARNTAGPDEETLPVRLVGQMMGHSSPDGIHWTPIEKTILDEWHDTHNLAAYDNLASQYVGYFRGFYGGRRAVSYAATGDFSNWPATEVVHHALPQDPPDVSLYSNTFTRYPGRPDVRLMFPAMYHQGTGQVDVALAMSLDGKNWSRHTSGPIIENGEEGEPDEGCIYPGPDLLRTADGRFRLIYHGSARHHNQGLMAEGRKANERISFYAWAEWPEDRLVGIRARDHGELTILPQPCGDRLLVNLRAEPGGSASFELVDRLPFPPIEMPGLEGYRFEDSEPVTGDHTGWTCAWRGRADLSALRGTSVAIRVRLDRATLFATRMENAPGAPSEDEIRLPV